MHISPQYAKAPKKPTQEKTQKLETSRSISGRVALVLGASAVVIAIPVAVALLALQQDTAAPDASPVLPPAATEQQELAETMQSVREATAERLQLHYYREGYRNLSIMAMGNVLHLGSDIFRYGEVRRTWAQQLSTDRDALCAMGFRSIRLRERAVFDAGENHYSLGCDAQ